MLTRSFLIFMLVLSTMQSFAAVADLHQSHQSGTEHLEFDHNKHEHVDVDVDVDMDMKRSVSDVDTACLDCHHCCHCHSVHVPGMVSFTLALEIDISQFSYSPVYNSRLVKRQYALLRPPQV